MSFFPFPSAPLMISAGKLVFVPIDYKQSTSSDIRINLFRLGVDSTGKRNKMPRRASSSLAPGKILQTNPTTATYTNVTLVDKRFLFTTQTYTRRLCRCPPFLLINAILGKFTTNGIETCQNNLMPILPQEILDKSVVLHISKCYNCDFSSSYDRRQ